MGDLILVLSGALDSQETEWNKWKFTLQKKKYNTCVGVILFTQSVIGHLVNNQVHVGKKIWIFTTRRAWTWQFVNIVWIFLYCTCILLYLHWLLCGQGTESAPFLVLGGGRVALFIKEYNMHKLACNSCQDREPLPEIFGSFKVLGETHTKTSCEQSEMENYTILCR